MIFRVLTKFILLPETTFDIEGSNNLFTRNRIHGLKKKKKNKRYT